MAHKLGFGDRKTEPPKDVPGMISFLAEMMSATVNNEVELENVKVASNIASRIIELMQADTRMKAVAISTQRQISAAGYPLIQMENTLPASSKALD